MFQLFLRARTHNFFKARSETRDTDADRTRLKLIADALNSAIAAADAEHVGLDRRIDDVIARAAVTFGTGTDEYLERDAIDSQLQENLGMEIKNGQQRLRDLESQIKHLRFLKTAMITRFPELSVNPSTLHS